MINFKKFGSIIIIIIIEKRVIHYKLNGFSYNKTLYPLKHPKMLTNFKVLINLIVKFNGRKKPWMKLYLI